MVKINWDEVLTQAVTALVVATFIGAAAIVWTGATTVTDKVKGSEDKVLGLIKITSEEMAKTQAELRKDMAQMRYDLSNQITKASFMGPPSPQQIETEQSEKESISQQYQLQQKILQADFLDKFQQSVK